MRIRLLHAVLSGAIIAFVLGFYLIPETWQIISNQYEEPTFGSEAIDGATIGVIVSCTAIIITLLSFRLVRRVEE